MLQIVIVYIIFLNDNNSGYDDENKNAINNTKLK